MTAKPSGPLPAQADVLDFLILDQCLKGDAALARHLGLTAPAVSKLRNGRIKLSASMLLRIHDRTGIALDQIRARVRTA